MLNYAIVVAAGKGHRFGCEKQYCLIKGRPLLLYALDCFNDHKDIHSIVVAVPKNRIKYTKKLVTKSRFRKVKHIVAGGKRRQDSVCNALSMIKATDGVVAVHDGVRPMVSKNLVNRGIRLCNKYGAVIFGTQVRDTMKQVNHHTVVRTIPRSNVFTVQTPQFYKIKLLKNAFREGDPSTEYTDEAALFEALNMPVYLYQGDHFNIKVTRRSDFTILGKIL